MQSGSFWGQIVAALGGDRFVTQAVALANEGPMVFLYSGGRALFVLALLIHAAAFLILARRCAVEPEDNADGLRYVVVLSPRALVLYGAFCLALAGTFATSFLLLYAPIWRLDLVALGWASTVCAVSAVYTARAVWGPRHPADESIGVARL